MYITSDPKDKVYKDLLDLAFSECEQFILVVRQNARQGDIPSETMNNVLKGLSTFLIEKKEQYEWPGTRLWSGRDCFGRQQKPALVYYYRTQDGAKKILLDAANSLYSWLQPNLLEDLSFIKKQKPWLISTSHERQAYFETDDEYEIKKIESIKGLEVKTRESIRKNRPKVIYVNDPLNLECVFCKGNLHEGDIAPERSFVCMGCINNGLAICNVDRRIFDPQKINKDDLRIQDTQTLKIGEFDLLEYINKDFLDRKGGLCSKKCFHLFYLNQCIKHLQTYLNLASDNDETTSEIINEIRNNEVNQYILKNKIKQLETIKLIY